MLLVPTWLAEVRKFVPSDSCWTFIERLLMVRCWTQLNPPFSSCRWHQILHLLRERRRVQRTQEFFLQSDLQPKRVFRPDILMAELSDSLLARSWLRCCRRVRWWDRKWGLGWVWSGVTLTAKLLHLRGEWEKTGVYECSVYQSTFACHIGYVVDCIQK